MATPNSNAPNHKLIGTRNPSKTYTDRQSTRVVAIQPSGEIALLYVKEGSYYKLPGGGIEAEESQADAAVREVREETGAIVTLRNTGCFATTEEFRLHHHQISFCYLADVVDGTGEPCLTEEELADGYVHLWMTVNQALEAMSAAEPTTDFGCSVKERDIYVLTEAQRLIEGSR
ncbi:NUDIX hydrolase domain-like protein [Trichoderma barbatum]